MVNEECFLPFVNISMQNGTDLHWHHKSASEPRQYLNAKWRIGVNELIGYCTRIYVNDDVGLRPQFFSRRKGVQRDTSCFVRLRR